ncbi:hypothetical protein K443DRAFT_682189 [Laccaria amethystina LaAM-08-1]|uniref:Uncharacterized protein n=1 Tax=Laccaria amethystina LaAM-08-1 TaxID=1095629 RepID=A0A0C9XG62_9AGAR|nr:hypothetical protein K443DRAFT_682189 [Laccaria amethystina LaAM-08-1]
MCSGRGMMEHRTERTVGPHVRTPAVFGWPVLDDDSNATPRTAGLNDNNPPLVRYFMRFQAVWNIQPS